MRPHTSCSIFSFSDLVFCFVFGRVIRESCIILLVCVKSYCNELVLFC
jgi:hypothetical protein